MKKILSVLGLLAFTSFALWAQTGTNAMGRSDTPNRADAPTALTKHTLKGTYVSTGYFGANVGAGFTPIDAVNTVACPGTSGNCLLQADQWIQAGGSGTPDNSVAICFYVDNNPVDGCFFNGDTLTNGHYTQYTTSHGITVAHGNHTVQTILFTSAGAFVGTFTSKYQVYKP